jgi:predicted aspartyl protease
MRGQFLRACLLVLFAAAGGLPSAAPAAGDEAAALLAKHAAYAGWRGGDGNITSLRESGEAVRDDGTGAGSTLSRLQTGEIFHAFSAEKNRTREYGFTGKIFWQTNANGFTTPSFGDAVRYQATRVQLLNEELTSLPATMRGNATVDGVLTQIVRVVAQAGFPIDLYIDPSDGALMRYVIDPGGDYEDAVDVLASTDVGNHRRVLSSWRYVGGHTTYRYTKIEANTEVTAAELHPPKPVASWTFGPPAQTVPIDVTDQRIYLNAIVNGHPGRFVLDTGSFDIGFTDSFARTVGAKREGQTRIQGIGGEAEANIYRVDTIAFGASTLHDVRITTGLDERGGATGERVDGLIGFDLLGGAIVDLDLDARTLRILDPSAVAPDPSQGIMLRVDLSSGQPRVPMTVGGSSPVLATIDSGNTFYVLFSSKLISESHVRFFSDPLSLASRLEFVGVNGSEIDTCGRLPSLELGSINYRPVPACESESMAHNEILVGFDFFKSFNYVFDYPEGEILVSARKSH